MTRLLRHDQKSLGKFTEQFHLSTYWKSAGRRSSMVLRNGQLKIEYQLWQKEEEPKKRFLYCLNPNSPSHFLYLRAIQDIQEIMLLILSCKRIYWVHPPRREREWNKFHNQKWFDSWRTKSQQRKAICVLHLTNPMEDDNGVGGDSMRLDQAKDRSIQKYLESPSKLCFWGAIWSSLRWKDCKFSKHGHMKSFSTTHNLQLALRKRYVWNHRRSSTKKYA